VCVCVCSEKRRALVYESGQEGREY
jgi:hypothetical protein